MSKKASGATSATGIVHRLDRTDRKPLRRLALATSAISRGASAMPSGAVGGRESPGNASSRKSAGRIRRGLPNALEAQIADAGPVDREDGCLPSSAAGKLDQINQRPVKRVGEHRLQGDLRAAGDVDHEA
jgi:hypothetical protein